MHVCEYYVNRYKTAVYPLIREARYGRGGHLEAMALFFITN